MNACSGILEPAYLSSQEQTVKYSGILQASCQAVDSSKAPIVGVLKHYKISKHCKPGFCFCFFSSESQFTSTPLNEY